MDVRQLTYFLSVYNSKSFTKASQKEHIAQPALSVQIARLEKELGVILIRSRSSLPVIYRISARCSRQWISEPCLH